MSVIKIGVVSDTHLKVPVPALEKLVIDHFQEVEFILHAGDINTLDVLEAFKPKTVYAVSGNWDHSRVKANVPPRRIIDIQGFRIGLTHGWGSPFGIQKRVGSLFKDVDCIVFGHSHRAVNIKKGGILYFNPGTFRGDIFSWWRKTIGILTVGNEILGEIIRL